MGFFDIFGFCVSILQMYGVVVHLRNLLPRNTIPHVSAKLDDAQDTLAHAVTAGAIPHISIYREDLERYRFSHSFLEDGLLSRLHSFSSELALIRIKSHSSPGLFQQIQLAVRFRLTYRLYSLSSQIGAVRQRVELAMDEQRLALRAIPHNVVLTSMAIPVNGMQLTGYRFLVLTVDLCPQAQVLPDR
ncbi:hypothetical protein V8E53_015230 [Lactarius tabidus]